MHTVIYGVYYDYVYSIYGHIRFIYGHIRSCTVLANPIYESVIYESYRHIGVQPPRCQFTACNMHK